MVGDEEKMCSWVEFKEESMARGKSVVRGSYQGRASVLTLKGD